MNNQPNNQKDDREEEVEDLEDMEEEIVSEEDTERPQEQIKKLRQKLKECEAQKQEYLEGWQRIRADFVNAKKKSEEEKESFIKYSTQELIIQLIPVLDSFEMALKDSPKDTSVQEWYKGVKYIHDQFKTLLTQNGVEEISPKKGEVFNPQEQEAISSQPVENEKEDNTVVELVQKGYKLNDRIVRAAKVRIGQHSDN